MGDMNYWNGKRWVVRASGERRELQFMMLGASFVIVDVGISEGVQRWSMHFLFHLASRPSWLYLLFKLNRGVKVAIAT